MIKQFIKRIITLNIIFALIMTIYRIIFTFYYSDWAELSQYFGDLVQAFVLGVRYDCAVLAYINSLVTLFFILFWFIGSQKLFVKFVKSLKYYYTIFFGCIVTLLCIDFGFYSYFQNHMNILMFGVFEDDTKALFSTIAENYPVVWVGIGFILIFVFVYVLTKLVLEKKVIGYYIEKTKIHIKIILALVLLCANFIIARGSFGLFPLGVDNAEISTNTFINKVAINGIYTLQAAIEARSKQKDRDYIAKMGYSKDNMAKTFADFLNVDVSSIDKQEPENSLKRTTKYNKNIEEIKPNVVFIMMEALGTDLMHYNSESFNVLGEFKKHLDEDIVFYKFLPANMGTIGSLESAMTNIARLPLSQFLCQSKYAYNKYFYTGPVPYKNKGYETIFMYGGNAGWRNCTAYMPNVGFDKVIGEGSMPKEYERNQWGVYDEYLFDYILKTLGENDNSKFVYIMTTSNHPPYSLPSNYKQPYPLEINEELKKDITGDKTLSKMRFATYQYSCQKVGEFLTKLKNSKFADNTIVAITGDHNFWNTFSYSVERKLDEMSVPFYLYIPKKLRPDSKADTDNIVGSHTDILPTLYNLSLSNTDYWATGTDLLSDEAEQNIASNCLGSIMTKDNFVIYDFASGKEKYYTWNKEKPREIVPAEQNEEHKNMVKHYKSSVAIAYYMLQKPEKETEK
ncbi:LTA synthase family protein [Candidatus Ruminimicrobiellum ovillum]|uniref:LTA synthase family protein n=1 Tax=Candidatus Ruminimicrobiellum ovillum TaxID=1947927 RepID=UPI0035596A35